MNTSLWLVFLIVWSSVWAIFAFITSNLIYGVIQLIIAIIAYIVFRKLEKK